MCSLARFYGGAIDPDKIGLRRFYAAWDEMQYLRALEGPAETAQRAYNERQTAKVMSDPARMAQIEEDLRKFNEELARKAGG